MRRRRQEPDELGQALERARTLWDRFLRACTERDHCHLAGNVPGVAAANRTINDLDQMLTAAERRVAQLDAVEARERGPRSRARVPRVHHTEGPRGGETTPRRAVTPDGAEEKSL